MAAPRVSVFSHRCPAGAILTIVAGPIAPEKLGLPLEVAGPLDGGDEVGEDPAFESHRRQSAGTRGMRQAPGGGDVTGRNAGRGQDTGRGQDKGRDGSAGAAGRETHGRGGGAGAQRRGARVRRAPFPLECGAVPAAGAIRGFCVIIGLENIEGEQAHHD